MKKSTLRLRKGFTLIEMVIVIGLIALILGAAITNFTGVFETGNLTKSKDDVLKLNAALTSYRTLAGSYPSDAQGLEALVTKPTTSPKPKMWTQQFDEIPLDPWETPYKYRRSGSKDSRKPEVISAGPDKQFGTDDDISSQNN